MTQLRPEMAHRDLFPYFFKAMKDEMDRNYSDKGGDSWLVQDNVSTGSRSLCPMGVWLDSLLGKAVDEYMETKDLSQLTDIANFCAMRSIRGRLELQNGALSKACQKLEDSTQCT